MEGQSIHRPVQEASRSRLLGLGKRALRWLFTSTEVPNNNEVLFQSGDRNALFRRQRSMVLHEAYYRGDLRIRPYDIYSQIGVATVYMGVHGKYGEES